MGLDRRDMMELEIPEEYIKCIRTVNSNIELSYMKSMSYTNDDVEAVFYEIRREWVVSVHRAEDNGVGYSLRRICVDIVNRTIRYICSLNYKLSGDGYAEEDIFSKLPDKLYRPVKYRDLRYFVNTEVYEAMSWQLYNMYYTNTDSYDGKQFKKRFADVLIY